MTNLTIKIKKSTITMSLSGTVSITRQIPSITERIRDNIIISLWLHKPMSSLIIVGHVT